MAEQKPSSGGFLTFFVAVLLFALLVGFGYLLYEAVQEAPTVVGSFITALGAVIAVVAGRVWEKRQELEQARRERIADTYREFVEMVYNSTDETLRKSQDEIAAFFRDWARGVLLYGSKRVITAFNGWRAVLPEDPDDAASRTRPQCSL